MPEPPGGPAHFFAVYGAAAVFEDVLVAHAVEEGDEAEGEFVFGIWLLADLVTSQKFRTFGKFGLETRAKATVNSPQHGRSKPPPR